MPREVERFDSHCTQSSAVLYAKAMAPGCKARQKAENRSYFSLPACMNQHSQGTVPAPSNPVQAVAGFLHPSCQPIIPLIPLAAAGKLGENTPPLTCGVICGRTPLSCLRAALKPLSYSLDYSLNLIIAKTEWPISSCLLAMVPVLASEPYLGDCQAKTMPGTIPAIQQGRPSQSDARQLRQYSVPVETEPKMEWGGDIGGRVG